MHPLLRNVVISVVGLLIAGGLAALGLLGEDSDLSVLLLLVSALLAAAIGIFLFVQAWIWSGRSAAHGHGLRSVMIAVGGGVMALVAAGSLAGATVLVLLFYLG